MNDNKFEVLRKQTSLFENRELKRNKRFSTELFFNTPCYTQTKDPIDEYLYVDCNCEEVSRQKTKSEKSELLDSFQNFTTEKLKDSDTLEFKGGSIKQSISVDGESNIDLEFSPYENLENYLKMLNSCNLCKEEVGENRQIPVNDLVKNSGSDIDILFVGGRAYEDNYIDGEGNSFVKEKRDLIKKMTSAMNIEGLKYSTTLAVKCIFKEGKVDGSNESNMNCLKNLMHEIYLLRPKIVITFGAFSTNLILSKKEKLSKIHGHFFKKNINFAGKKNFTFTLMPIFHPEFLLINPKMKRAAWEDLQKVIEYLSRDCSGLT